jgi:hypothetical protein
VTAHCIIEDVGEFVRRWRHGEARGVEQTFEQLRAAAELVGKRGSVREHLREELG